MRIQCALAAACLLASTPGGAQVEDPGTTTIQTDGRFGAMAYDVPGTGGLFQIPESLPDPGGAIEIGRRQGTNLFHSLSVLELAGGDTAEFLTDMPTGNVIALVPVGDGPSPIFGTLKTDASLWLLSPQGFFFGDGAELDLNGSFYASSADEVRFADGSTLDVADGDGTVTAASPTHFGFTSFAPGGITVAMGGQTALEVDEGETIALVGGDVLVEGTLSNETPIVVQIENGTVQIAAVKGSGDPDDPVEVPVDLAQLDIDAPGDPIPDDRLGRVQIGSEEGAGRFGAVLDVFDEDGVGPAGRIVIRGGELVMVAGVLRAGTAFGQPGSHDAVDVQVRDMAMTGGEIVSTAFDGRAGRIWLRGRTLAMDSAATVGSNLFALAAGASGDDVGVEVDFEQSVSLDEGATILTRTAVFPGGSGTQPGGAVAVETGTLSLDGGASIVTLTEGEGAGRAGRIEIAADEVTLEGDSVVATAPRADSASDTAFGVDPSVTGLGGGGDIVVEAARVLVDGSSIAATSFGESSAGSIRVARTVSFDAEDNFTGEAADEVRITGRDGSATRIAARSSGNAPAGSVEMWTETLVVEQGAVVSTATAGPEAAGDVSIRAEVVRLRGADASGNRSALVALTSGSGDGGDVDVVASRLLEIRDGGQITAASDNVAAGAAGNVRIQAGDVRITGSEDAVLATSLSGVAGDVDIDATGDVLIVGASPVVRTVSRGASGGNIDIDALGTVAVIGADIAADAELSPEGGDRAGAIRIAGSGVFVGGASQVKAAAGANASGGSIQIDTGVFLVPGGILEQEGGGSLTSLFGDVFDVSSVFGTSGDIQIQAPESQLTAQVAALPANYLDLDRLAADQCAAREGPAGSLVVEGRDRAPRAPDEALPVLYRGAATP